MHYQSQILSVDSNSGFLLAVCHGMHKISGEDPREVGHARFAFGRVTEPDLLRDLAEVCLPPWPASPARARREEKMAGIQEELARSGNYSASTALGYRDNARRMRHAARLAQLDGRRAPRRVYASRTGLALLGYEPEISDLPREDLPGCLRLVDVQTGSLRAEWCSSRTPRDPPGAGLRRFSSVQLGRPAALASDGASLLLSGAGPHLQPRLLACRLDAELGVIAEHSVYASTVLAIRDGWVVISHDRVLWLGPELQTMAQQPLPRGAMYDGAVSFDGSLLAMPTLQGGELLLLSREGGKPRRLVPHRGVRRDDYLSLALSDDGQWLASTCAGGLVITRVRDGVSWPAGALSDSVHEDESFDHYRVSSRVPAALGFVGSSLLTLQQGQLQTCPLEPDAEVYVSEQGRKGSRKPVRVRGETGLDALVHAARLDAQSDAIRRYYSPAASLQATALKDSGWMQPGHGRGPALGESRLGGWPDLIPEQPWPTWEGRPMAFLAQIDLAAAHRAQPELRLPRQGLLSFFLGCSDEDYETDKDPRSRYLVDPMVGTEVEGGGAWKVLFETDTTRLQRREYGDTPLPELFEPCTLQFTAGGLALPNETTAAYEVLFARMSHAERDNYNDLLGQLRPGSERILDQFMGYPRLLQGTPPEWQCELSARGRDPWRIPQQGDPEHELLRDAAADWGMLLQLTSSNAGFMWGDGGHLYFYGPRVAMERGDFSGVWVNYEC